MDFSHLKKHEVKNKTKEYPIFEIAGDPTPTLILKPATESNKKYFNALLKKSRKSVRALNSGKLDSSVLEENRKQDRELYPQFVVDGWENIVDSTGKNAEFTVENCKSFLEALPDWIFDNVRKFAADPRSFMNEDPGDPDELAKN